MFRLISKMHFERFGLITRAESKKKYPDSSIQNKNLLILYLKKSGYKQAEITGVVGMK